MVRDVTQWSLAHVNLRMDLNVGPIAHVVVLTIGHNVPIWP